MRGTVLFDLDGTLTDPATGIVACLQHALRQLGREVWPDRELLRFIGPPLQLGFAEILQTRDEVLIGQAVAHYRERFSTVGLFENQVYAGIPELLAELQTRGAQLFVATSKPTVFARRILEHFGLMRYFSQVYGSELSGERANKAELIGHIVQSEGPRADSTRMVGDRSHDVIGASAHGIPTVGVLWGYGDRAELEAAGANEIVSDVTALRQCLLR